MTNRNPADDGIDDGLPVNGERDLLHPGVYEREGRRLITEANAIGHSDPQRGMAMIASAQFYATLTVAAATHFSYNDQLRLWPAPDFE